MGNGLAKLCAEMGTASAHILSILARAVIIPSSIHKQNQ